jgi:hypothetical protein
VIVSTNSIIIIADNITNNETNTEWLMANSNNIKISTYYSIFGINLGTGLSLK